MDSMHSKRTAKGGQVTATGSTVFVVEIQALQKLLAEKDAQIEQLNKELAFQTDMAAQADVACIRLKALLARAADALEASWSNPEFGLRGPMEKLVQELRKAAK